MSDGYYITFKLVSGEEVISILTDEDESYLRLENPMIIRGIVNYETGKEHITARPLSQFTDDTTYVLHKKDIMYVKKLHHSYVDTYNIVVEQYNTVGTLQEPSNEETVEKFYNKLQELQSRYNLVPDEEEDKTFFISGNDTIN